MMPNYTNPIPQLQSICLTSREKEILNLIFEEKSSKQIANDLGISTRTVETHRANLLIKLNVKTSVGLVKIAYEMITKKILCFLFFLVDIM